MEARYTIGQLAAAAAVPTTTVRYYERRGLLRPAARYGSGSYRAYGENEVQRLRFIRAAQGSGFALDDVAMLLALRAGETEPCREVQEVLKTRLGDVAARLQDLQRVERFLKASLRTCRQHEREGRCEVMQKLASSSASTPGRRKR